MKVTIGKKNEEQTACETKSVENTVVNETNIPEFAEVVEKRGRCQKVFTDGKGKSMTKFYGKPVHRKTVNGFEPIDNTLSESDEDYHTTFGNYNARFFKNRIKGKIFDVEKDQCSVALVSRDVAEHDCITENCGSEDEDVCSDGKIVLHGIRENTDIEYLTKSDRIKENIIIKERSDKYDYEFDLALENLTVKASADGNSLEIINKGNGTLWGYIPAPFMYDANGKRSDDVYYEIDTEGKDISLKVIADERWINSEERAFPVVIDPQIVITNYYGYGYETEEYDDGIFEFNTYSELPFSGTRELIGHEVRAEADEDYPMPDTVKGNYVESDIIIHKSRINQLIFANMNKAVLKFNILSSTATSFNVNEHAYSVQDNRNFTLDITNLLKLNENEENIIVTVSQYAARGTYYAGATYYDLPVLEIEYLYCNAELLKYPDKTIYLSGERLNCKGMVIEIQYEDETSEQINDLSILPSETLNVGMKGVNVYFFDKFGIMRSVYVSVTVKPQKIINDNLNYIHSSISSNAELDPAKNELIFSAAGSSDIIVDMVNGESKVIFNDIITENSPIYVDVAHVCKNGNSDNSGNGIGFKLTIDESLTRDYAGNFVYVDPIRRQHTCNEMYYYVDENNKKRRVYISNIIVDKDGRLTYNGYEVYKESCIETGMIFDGELKGKYKNLKYFEQRSNDKISIEENMISCKNIFDQYVIADDDFVVKYELKNYYSNVNDFDDFMKKSLSYQYILTKSESIDGKVLIQNKTDLEGQKSALEYEKTELEAKIKEIEDKISSGIIGSIDNLTLLDDSKNKLSDVNVQLNNINFQINIVYNRLQLLKDKKTQVKEMIENCFKTYLTLNKQFNELKRSEPVSYAYDGNIVKAFNENGNLIGFLDAYENQITFLRNQNGNVTDIFNGEEKEATFSYDYKGNLAEINDSRGRKVTYGYEAGKLVKIIYNDGGEKNIVYDNSNRIIEIAHSNGDRTKICYNHNGKLISIYTYARNVLVKSCNIDYTWNKTVVITSNGEVAYEFSDGKLSGYTEIKNGRVVQSEKYSCEYNSDGRKTSTHIERAKASALNSFGINEFNYVKGESVDIVYDDFGQQTTRTENGLDGGDGVTKRITAYTYDNDHHPICAETKVYGANDELLYTAVMKQDYSVFGKVVREESYIVGEEDTSGVSVTEHYYDDKGREIKSFSYNSLDSGSKFVTEHSYDDIGRETAAYGETGERTAEYEYFDGTRSVRSEKYAGGGVLAYGKDISENVTAITQSTEDGEENSTLTRYDNGIVAEVKSGGTSIGYEYDDKGRTTKIKLNGSDYITCAYTEDIPNADGSDSDKVTAINAKGEVFEKVTDKSGNVQSVTYNGAEQWNATYDKNGNAKKIEDKVSGETLTFTYDRCGRAVSHTAEKDGEQTYTESVTYNEFGKATETTLGNRTYTFTYKNNAERTLDGVTTGGITFRPKTDILGRNAGRSIENASSEIACEKIRYRKAGDHATNMPQCVDFKGERITYSYDKLGNITEIKENGELQARYKYDTLGRLVREDNKKLNKTETYTYDGNGNILEKRVYGFTVIAELEGIEHETKTYAYDGDKLISYDGQPCEYDEVGNPTTYKNKVVTWEKDRNMTAYDGVAFAYDGRGRRMSKGNITFSYSASGKLIGQSNGVEFIYDGNGIAGIVYGDSTYFYRKDAQGNITALIDSSGNVVVRYTYDAWGNHTVRGNDGTEIAEAMHIGNINPIRYRGYYYDTEIGLYYLQTRYYDPTTGRFVTIDGIAYADPESINGLNLYAYCGNNPVMNVDPNGNKDLPWWAKILIGIGVIVLGAAVTALTAGTGAGFIAAFGAAMVTSLKAVAVSTAISAGIGFAMGALTTGTIEGAFSGLLEGAVDGFMWGGIFAGGAQILSGGFKVLAKAGVSYSKKGFFKIFTPNRLRSAKEIAKIANKGQKYYEYGGTLIKIGKNMLDISNKTFLHVHLWFTGSVHIPLGTILAGIIGGF